jgi:hypothetical protein
VHYRRCCWLESAGPSVDCSREDPVAVVLLLLVQWDHQPQAADR